MYTYKCKSVCVRVSVRVCVCVRTWWTCQNVGYEEGESERFTMKDIEFRGGPWTLILNPSGNRVGSEEGLVLGVGWEV